MKDKDIINSYLKSIKDELMMYSDSLSEKNLNYIDKLKNSYECWEKDLATIDSPVEIPNVECENGEYHKSLIEEYMDNVIDEFKAFKEYKELYKSNGSQETLDMAHTELGHMIKNLSDMFDELSDYTNDNIDERAMIKSAIKLMYQSFS